MTNSGQYSDGDPITGSSNAGVVDRNRDSQATSGAPLRVVNSSTAKCNTIYDTIRYCVFNVQLKADE